MEKIKQQFGTTFIDGTEKRYCNVSLLIDSENMISKEGLEKQFRLVAESFWIYINKQDESVENKGAFSQSKSTRLDAMFAGKEWEEI